MFSDFPVLVYVYICLKPTLFLLPGTILAQVWIFFLCLVEDVRAADVERVISTAQISSAKPAGAGRSYARNDRKTDRDLKPSKALLT